MKKLTLAILTVLCCIGFVQGQTETGQITGTILDQSGGSITNATVTLVEPTTKSARTVMTSSGIYVFANLLAGRYEVTATAAGFQTTKQVVTVTVGSKIGLDFQLQVGTQTQVVEVQEQVARINTETQTLSQNISGREIVDLPTITRNPYDLVKTIGNTTASGPDARGRGVNVSINGLRSSDVGILLDGVPNNNNFDTTVAIQTPLDSVGEFTVLTSNFTAEYGRALAGVVNVNTKRGNNGFHGTAYEFNRVSGLVSNTYDNNANGIPVSPFTRNQFGFSIGGPFKKDKLFFFGNPEWLRIRSEAIQTATIPTPQLIALSAPATQQFFSAFGALAPGVTPLQTFTYAQACNPTNSAAGAAICNVIPNGTIAYQKVAYSAPADSGGGDPQNGFLFAGRVDYNLSESNQIYFRYARFDTGIFAGDVNNSPYAGYNTGENDMKNSYALSLTHILSPTMVSQTKLSFNRITIVQPLVSAPRPTLYTTTSATNSLGGASIVYPGYNEFSPGVALPSGGPQNYFQISEDVTKVFGKHNVRVGGLYTYLQDNHLFGAFENAVEGLGTNTATSINNFLSGTLQGFEAAIYPQGKFPCIGGVQTPACTLTLPIGPPSFSRSNLFHEAALYVQDSWKVRPRLTLNLGLRWEYFGPQGDKNPALDSNFYLGPGSNLETQAATGQVIVSNSPNNPIGGLWAKTWTNFEPRIGAAWDVFGDGKTSLRGGYGLGYIPNFGNVTFNVIQNPPNYGVVTLVSGVDVPTTIPIVTDNTGPFAGTSGTKALSAVNLRAVDPHIKTAYAHLWSASFEHQFGSDLIAALEYTGSKGSNLYSIAQLNLPGSGIVYAGTGPATGRINQQYGAINFRTNGGFSEYNALNARLEMRNFRKQGLTLRANYTYSHAIDNNSNTFDDTPTGSGNLGVLDALNPGLDKGNAEYDVRHRFLLAAVWDIPFKNSNKILKEVAGGWSVIPSFSARTGNPFTVFDCTNAFSRCPRVMYDQPFKAAYSATPTSTPNVFNYLNLGTPDPNYVNPSFGFSDYGPFPATMTGRNVFVGPGAWTFDFAAHKNFTLTERFTLQLRAEAFNIFNHSNLYIVNGNTDAGATSFVTAQKGTYFNDNSFGTPVVENRNLQLALKLIF